MPDNTATIYPVLLSGGSGSRLWPLSRKALPKQLLSLVGPMTMFHATIARVRGDEFGAPLVIANQEHRFYLIEKVIFVLKLK